MAVFGASLRGIVGHWRIAGHWRITGHWRIVGRRGAPPRRFARLRAAVTQPRAFLGRSGSQRIRAGAWVLWSKARQGNQQPLSDAFIDNEKGQFNA